MSVLWLIFVATIAVAGIRTSMECRNFYNQLSAGTILSDILNATRLGNKGVVRSLINLGGQLVNAFSVPFVERALAPYPQLLMIFRMGRFQGFTIAVFGVLPGLIALVVAILYFSSIKRMQDKPSELHGAADRDRDASLSRSNSEGSYDSFQSDHNGKYITTNYSGKQRGRMHYPSIAVVA